MKKVVIIGSLNIDLVINVDHIPKPGETIIASGFDYVPGGKGANQAYASAKLGNNTTMLGCVGNDTYGDILINNLKSVGVCTKHVAKTDIATGMAFIHVEKSGNNCISVVPQSNNLVTKQYIDQNIDVIKQSDVVIFQLEIPIDTVIHSAKIAKQYGKTVILDPAPAPKQFPDELYSYTDIITPNESELELLIGCKLENYDTDELDAACQVLHKKSISCVIVTLGSKGVYLSANDDTKLLVPAQPAKVVDTTAAGDTFAAAFVSALNQGQNMADAVKFANKASSITVSRSGAQSSIPTLKEVQEKFRL